MKNKKKNIDKRKIIMLSAIVILIIILAIIVGILEDNKEEVNNNESATVGFTSIEQILERYECELIKETKSSDKNYTKDLYVRFKYNTFEGTESKKRYYENIISYLAAFIDASYRLIDEDKDLVIEVQKRTSEGITLGFAYAVNGVTDYFIKQESKVSLENYEEDNQTKIQVNSEILNQIISNKWNKNNINFGTKDSNFDKYDIYFDEGLEVRNISGKVHNIIFTKKYGQEVINGITAGTNFNEIVKKIGDPTFGNIDGQFIGYKNSEIYVFFLKDSISIYRNEKVEMEEFDDLLNKYVEKKIDIKEFMNELTYLWSDYEEYNYTSSYIFINYPSKGIKIEMREDSPLGIIVYKNCNITENLKKLINEGKISSKLEEDLNENTLENKINKEEEYRYMLYMNDGNEIEENSLTIKSDLFYLYTAFEENYISKVLFTSKTNDYANRELNEKINQGFFANDNIYIYSIKNKGIYAFDVITGNKNSIITGKEEFELKEYNNGLLYYDEEQINLNLE